MPGFLVSSGQGSLDGQSNSIFYSNVGTASAAMFTASLKTRINSLLAVNKTPGILPISVYVKRGENVFCAIKSERVRKTKELIQTVGPKEPDLLIKLAPGSQETTIENDLPPEIILIPGDILFATSLINDSFDIIASIREGVQ